MKKNRNFSRLKYICRTKKRHPHWIPKLNFEEIPVFPFLRCHGKSSLILLTIFAGVTLVAALPLFEIVFAFPAYETLIWSVGFITVWSVLSLLVIFAWRAAYFQRWNGGLNWSKGRISYHSDCNSHTWHYRSWDSDSAKYDDSGWSSDGGGSYGSANSGGGWGSDVGGSCDSGDY